jgi:hypothetical protein
MLIEANYSGFFIRSIVKKVLRVISVLLFLHGVSAVIFAAEGEVPASLEIRPQNEKEWEASPRDVEKVLNSTARELWIYFPHRKLPAINVYPKGGPITLFQRGPSGEIQIKLSTGKTFWAQYAFQFSHELCHALCDCKPQENPNHWFEESLCETASLFTLRKMAVTWAAMPPYPNWKDYSKALTAYADDRIALGKLPGGTSFPRWFADNERDMRLNSTDRARNNVVAGVLLPLFEAEPKMWEAVTYLNTEKLSKLYSLKQYLEAWRRNSEPKHRAFIDAIAKQFEEKNAP